MKRKVFSTIAIVSFLIAMFYNAYVENVFAVFYNPEMFTASLGVLDDTYTCEVDGIVGVPAGGLSEMYVVNATWCGFASAIAYCWLKIDLLPISWATVIDAKLWLMNLVENGLTTPLAAVQVHHCLFDSWSEETLELTNQPAFDGKVFDVSATPEQGGWFSLELTTLVNMEAAAGKSVMSIVLATTHNMTAKFETKESGASPRFEVTYNSGMNFETFGDVNGDGKVDLKDVIKTGKAFGSIGPDFFGPGEPADPKWDPNCDIVKDNKIDLKDYFGVAKEYGKADEPPPNVWSDSYELQIPDDGNNKVCYKHIVRIFVPASLSGSHFHFKTAKADDWILDVQIDKQLKYEGGCVPNLVCQNVDVELGPLGTGYHLLEFNLVEQWLGGIVNFSIPVDGNPANGYAYLVRFRAYIPDYCNAEWRYKVRTHTLLPFCDDYFLQGFADDYIDQVRLGDGELYNDWQWNQGSGQTIYAWRDGFRYPLGYVTDQDWKRIEFDLGKMGWDAGLVDFRYLSYSHDKTLIGLPEFVAWCNANVTDPGTTLDLIPFTWGNMTMFQRRYYVGSDWTDSAAPGKSKRFISTSQEMDLFDNQAGIHVPIHLGFGIGWAIPKFDETAEFGAMINMSCFNQEPRFGIGLEGVTLDINTPPQSCSISGLVYRDAHDPNSDNILSVGGRIAISATAGILNWQASEAMGAGMMGPQGMAIALIGTAVGKEIYDYAAGHQEEDFGESPGGNRTHRQIWYNSMLQMLDFHLRNQQSKSHIIYIGLGEYLPNSCGAVKLVLRGKITLAYYVVDKFVNAEIAFEMGVVIPVFVW